MKVGMIFECGPQGADVRVCTYLAKRLRPDLELSTVTLDNKPRLLANCGKAAAQLLREGCDRVVIVWDLYPPWRASGVKPCRKEDRDSIQRSLAQASIASEQVFLVCIREELEAWLLADRRALENHLSRPTRPAVVAETSRPESCRNPKGRIQHLFRQHNRAYNDLVDAERIVQNLPDLRRLHRSCETFRRFALKVADLQSPD